jgi:enediyne biosynthesis protein E4
VRRSRPVSRAWNRAGRVALAGLLAALAVRSAPGAAAAPSSAAAPAPPVFVNVGRQAGLTLVDVCGNPDKDLITETVGNGVCLGDVDGDGFLDIFLPNGNRPQGFPKGSEPRSALYRNRGDLTFEDVTATAGVGAPGYWAQGCVFGDYDDDGRIDLFVTGFGRYYLYRNLGGLRFQDVTVAAGLQARGWSTGAAFGDYDRDGRIDLYVSHYLDYDASSPPLPKPGSAVNCFYKGVPVMCGPRGLKAANGRLFHNEGGGRFRDVTATSGLRTDAFGYGLGTIWTDLDLDGDLDLYVANDSTPNYLYRNDGHGHFREIGTTAGVAYNEEGRTQASMGVDSGDYDNDGRPDLIVTNFSHDYVTLYHNEGGLFFLDVSLTSGIGAGTLTTLGWGTQFLDYDNDGRRDIVVSNGHVYPRIAETHSGSTWHQANQLFHNEGGGRFREVTRDAGPAFQELHSARGLAIGDLDNDGDLDMVISNVDETPSLLRNDGGNRRHYIGFDLVGARPNRGAIGARVTVVAGTLRQFAEVHAGTSHMSCSDPRLLFGLGDATTVDKVEIRWPSGRTQTLVRPPVDRYHTVREQETAPR